LTELELFKKRLIIKKRRKVRYIVMGGKFSGRKSIAMAVIVVLALSLLFSSCGKKSAEHLAAPQSSGATAGYWSKSDVSYDGVPSDASAPAEEHDIRGLGYGSETEAPGADAGSELLEQRKIIMEGEVSLETKEFDDAVSALDELVSEYGGFVESRNVTGKRPDTRSLRRASYVIRVPSESFELVMQDLGGIGTVIESNSKGTDITDSYVDLEARLKTLKVQEDTLLDILSKSTELEDVIKLESRISEVRYEIERIENQLRNYDRLIAFSRISVFIQEVDDASETVLPAKSLAERISSAFRQSIKEFRLGFEDFVVWVVESWISLVFLIIIASGIYIAVKRNRNRQFRKKAAEQKEIHNKTEENDKGKQEG